MEKDIKEKNDMRSKIWNQNRHNEKKKQKKDNE